MKKYLLAVLVSVGCASSYAQRAKVSAEELDAPIHEAMSKYDFAKAEELLQQKISLLEKKRKSTDMEDSLLDVVRRNEVKFHATERIIIIDSLVVPKAKLLESLKLGSESGSVDTYSHYFERQDTTGATVFENQLKNQIVFSAPDKRGVLKLYESVKNGDEWSKPTLLKGLEDAEEDNLNWPFVLSDGQTLYYAAQTEESLGGYDIFMTRYDADARKYLMPENVGMPFNSPANDYMMVIDEFNNLGWFATDRNQPEGSVCVYTFIPNETRKTYEEGTVSEEKLMGLARIASIKDTWTDKKGVKEAQQRLASLRAETDKAAKKSDFCFVINDKLTYYSLDDFHNDKAREKAAWWVETKKELEKTANELQSLRDQYAQDTKVNKATLAPQIRILESKYEQQQADLKQQEKVIRKTELNK